MVAHCPAARASVPKGVPLHVPRLPPPLKAPAVEQGSAPAAAHDRNLGRDVALKVLPDFLADFELAKR